MIRRPFFWI
jgi:hypothetical protein